MKFGKIISISEFEIYGARGKWTVLFQVYDGETTRQVRVGKTEDLRDEARRVRDKYKNILKRGGVIEGATWGDNGYEPIQINGANFDLSGMHIHKVKTFGLKAKK